MDKFGMIVLGVVIGVAIAYGLANCHDLGSLGTFCTKP